MTIECERRFEPDRIMAHMKQHWSEQKMIEVQTPRGGGVGSGTNGSLTSRPSSAAGHSRSRSMGPSTMGVGVERMLSCYSCGKLYPSIPPLKPTYFGFVGRHYGHASLPIHLSNAFICSDCGCTNCDDLIGQCPATRRSLNDSLPVSIRPSIAKPPSLPIPTGSTLYVNVTQTTSRVLGYGQWTMRLSMKQIG
jgi:hypothetical protein